MKGIAKIEYYVFTDNMSLSSAKNVHLIAQECAGFPADTLFRFEMFLKIKRELEHFDYIFFFNSNTEFKGPIGKEILPSSNEALVGAKWPFQNNFLQKNPAFYPYERNKKSLAYISPYGTKPYIYYMGGINGGTASAYIKMIEILANNIRKDFRNGIIAKVHDESHINKYFRIHTCKVLPREYCWPEEWQAKDFSPKIIFRDKVKVDKYFNKGRNHSWISKLKKSFLVLFRAIQWYV